MRKMTSPHALLTGATLLATMTSLSTMPSTAVAEVAEQAGWTPQEMLMYGPDPSADVGELTIGTVSEGGETAVTAVAIGCAALAAGVVVAYNARDRKRHAGDAVPDEAEGEQGPVDGGEATTQGDVTETSPDAVD